MTWPLICASGAMLVTLGCRHARGDNQIDINGLDYQLKVLEDPHPNRVHILRVDVTHDEIQPVVILAPDPDGDGPAEAALTDPLKLASDHSVVAFVNTNPWDSFPGKLGRRNRLWFEGQHVDIHGLAVSGNQVRSASPPGPRSIWINASGDVSFGHAAQDSPVEAIAGFRRVVREGMIPVPASGDRHPRTAIGVDRSANTMWLVVVDGRQKQYSEGMDLHELGRVMLDLGCWNAMNMDGGGSSVMGLRGADGILRVVNRPSNLRLGGRKLRPLPMILSIQRRASDPPARQDGPKDAS